MKKREISVATSPFIFFLNSYHTISNLNYEIFEHVELNENLSKYIIYYVATIFTTYENYDLSAIVFTEMN